MIITGYIHVDDYTKEQGLDESVWFCGDCEAYHFHNATTVHCNYLEVFTEGDLK